jgi:hypothetical protein
VREDFGKKVGVVLTSFSGAREEGPYQSAPNASTKIKRETLKNGSLLKNPFHVFMHV